MSELDQPPAWLPDDLRRYWEEGELRPRPTARCELGDVPAGTDLTVRAPAGRVSLVAASVGRGATLHLIGNTSHSVTVDGFKVIHLVDALPKQLLFSGLTNIHVHVGGSTLFRSPDEGNGAAARVWLNGQSGPKGACTLTTSVPLRSVNGTTSAAVDLRWHSQDPGGPVEAEGTVALSDCASLTVHGPLERADVDIAGKLVVTKGLVGACTVSAGSIFIGPKANSTSWSPSDEALVEAGTTLRARKGKLVVAGCVNGTSENLVSITGAREKDVQVGACEHTTLSAADGQAMGAVTVGSTTHVTINNAGTVTDQHPGGAQHISPSMVAAKRIKLTGEVHGGHLEADAVHVRDVADHATLKGRTVSLSGSAHDETGTVHVNAEEWIKAALPADLEVTASGSDRCQLLIGQKYTSAGPKPPADTVAENLFEEGVRELDREKGRTAKLALRGPLQVECCAEDTIVRVAEQVTSIRAAGQLQMAEGGTVGQVRSAGELFLGTDKTPDVTLSVTDIKAPAVLQTRDETAYHAAVKAHDRVHVGVVEVDSLTCARLHVADDAALGDLQVTKDTHVGGRLASSRAQDRAGAYRLSGTVCLADVEVPVTLKKAHGTITASDPSEGKEGTSRAVRPIDTLLWQEPTGSLRLEHPVTNLRVTSPSEQAELEVPNPADCERIELTGKLLIGPHGSSHGRSKKGSQAGSQQEPEEVEQPQFLLSDSADLTMKIAQPVRIDLQNDASARVHVENLKAVVHLGAETGSGQLTLQVPPRGSRDTGQLVQLQSADTDVRAGQMSPQPEIIIEGGDLLLSGSFADVLARDRAATSTTPTVPTTLHVPDGTIIHQLRGTVAIGEFHGRATGAEAARGPLNRFTSEDGTRLPKVLRKLLGSLVAEPAPDDRLVLVDPQRSTGGDETISKGVLVGADVTRLSFAELDRLKRLDVFSPEPVALERKARARPPRAAGRQSNAQHLSRIAELVAGRSVTGSVRSMANWAASTAHAATGKDIERAGRFVARMHGYGQRPLPALALLVAMVALTTAVLSSSGEEAAICRHWFDQADLAEEVAGYSWLQHLERVLLAPLAFLRVAGQGNGLAPLGCNSLVQVAGTIGVALPLTFTFIGLRNYLRSPVDR